MPSNFSQSNQPKGQAERLNPMKMTRMREDKSLKLTLDPDLSGGQPLYTDKKPESNFYHKKPFRTQSHKLMRTRSCPIIHPDLQEKNLYSIKTLVPERVQWPHSYHRYHLNDGYAVQDQGLSVIEARDERYRTNKGLHIRSSGNVAYAFDDRMKILLDAEDILRILQDRPPRGIYKHWNLHQLDEEFRRRWGRNGCWHDKGLELCVFLSCFEQSFHVFGDSHQYVRCRQNNGKLKAKMDRVLVNLARVQNPRLVKYQRQRLLNEINIKGYDLDGVANHRFAVDHKPRYPVPYKCFAQEEFEKFGVRREPTCEEVVQPLEGNI